MSGRFGPRFAAYLTAVAANLSLLYFLFTLVFPNGSDEIEDCKGLSSTLRDVHRDTNAKVAALWRCLDDPRVTGWRASLLFLTTWISSKALAVPGSMILCIALGGMTSSFAQAMAVATLCEVIGGACCYGLSGLFGGPLVERLAPKLLARARKETDKLVGDTMGVFWYTLFMRVTPLVPNWFVNAAAPIVGIPFKVFVAATAIGTQPSCFFGVSTGATLRALGNDALLAGQHPDAQDRTARNVGILFGLQFLALLPVMWGKFVAKKPHEE